MASTPRCDPADFKLPAVGVDTHAHLDFPEFSADLADILNRSRQAGLSHIGNVFLGPKAFEQGQGLFDQHPHVFFILGVHPHDAQGATSDTLPTMEQAFRRDHRLKALGEAGLDYHYNRSPQDVQRSLFQEQAILARELDIPLVVHSREAIKDTLDILADTGMKGRKVLWHCFGGNSDLAQIILGQGWTISIPGPVTFRKSAHLRQAVTHIPMNRLVLETDCPFLTPEPFRGKRNEPAFTVFTAKAVAEAQGRSLEEVWQACGQNAREFFGLTD